MTNLRKLIGAITLATALLSGAISALAQCGPVGVPGSLCGNPGAVTAAPAYTRTPVLGLPGTAIGTIGLAGNTSGTVTIRPQAAAGTYNFNLPTSAGTAGQPLLSGGGGSAAQTYGTLGPAAGGTGVANNASSTLTITGAFGTTLTVTGTTSLTLPTSGTLAILGANTFVASQALTLTTNATLSYTITNASTGTSALADFVATNSANTGSFGIGGTGYTATPILQNMAFVSATSGAGGVVINNGGDKPTIVARLNTEIARFNASGDGRVLTIGSTTNIVNGVFGVQGSSSGTITLQPQAAAGTYNWNWPTSAGTSGQPLLSGGGSSTAMSFGTLGVAGGGTGITSGTSGGIPYYSGSTTIASSGALTLNGVVYGGGAGASPLSTAQGGANTVLTANAGAPAFSSTPTISTITLAGGQIVFPATQNPSSDANTLDDYEEGTWTPVLTFATPGNLSVAYTHQVGTYVKIGKLVTVSFQIFLSTFTHTTASGALNITGLPFTSETLTNVTYRGSTIFQGITKATYTAFICTIGSNAAIVTMQASGSGVGAANVDAADMPTGGFPIISSTITYRTAN